MLIILVLIAAVPTPPLRTSVWRLLSASTHLAGLRPEPILHRPGYEHYMMPLVCQKHILLHSSSIRVPAIHCILLYMLSLGGETWKHKGCFLGCSQGRHKLFYEPDKSEMVVLFCTDSDLTNSVFCQGLVSVLGPHGSLLRAGCPPARSVNRQKEQASACKTPCRCLHA